MAAYDKTELWDGVAAKVFEGAIDGTELGLTGEVSITQEIATLDIKAAQTGEQILDKRVIDMRYRVSIDFKQIGAANWFKNWWLSGHTDTAGIIDLHQGSVGYSLPTKRIRLHPTIMADNDASKDFVFENLVIDKGPTQTMSGKGEVVQRMEMITLPTAASLPTIELGTFGHTLA